MTDHYEALFNSQFLRWFDLKGKPALVEITGVSKQELTLPGGTKNKAGVLALKQVQGHIEEIKPLVLNRTNGDSIAAIHGVRTKAWIGKQIVLFQDQTRLKGKTVECIRVREKREVQNA